MPSTKSHRTRLDRRPEHPLPHPRRARWIREHLLEWWALERRDFPWRGEISEYQLVVTEILLQQTTAAAVASAVPGFFERFPGWDELAAAPAIEVRAAIARLGLANRRCARLQDLADLMVKGSGLLPIEREELEAVPGIGPYVASAVLAARGEPEPLLDVNMARVLERLYGIRERVDIREDPWLQHASRRSFPGLELGWAVLDLAALVCRPRPRCIDCPLASKCTSAQRF